MASYHHYGMPHYQSTSSQPQHHGHHGRNRRAPRVSSQNTHRQNKMQRHVKEIVEVPVFNDYLRLLEAAKSFDIDDDEIYCPFHLLTDDDLLSIHSTSASERGSLSSGSPHPSPVQEPTLLSVPNAYASAALPPQHQHKVHQPLAQRPRNAIPIVDPSTRSVASPPETRATLLGHDMQWASSAPNNYPRWAHRKPL